MLIIICLKCGHESADVTLTCPKYDVSTELIAKHKNIYVISPKISRLKVISGILLLSFALIFIFINYQALAAICFIVGLTLALYDKFQDWCY